MNVSAARVADQIFMVTGKGGNIGLFIGADGTFLINDQFAPLTNRQQVADYRQMLATAYERLGKLKAEGKTAQEAAAAGPLSDLEVTWGDGLFKGDRWIEVIWPGV